MGSDTELLAQLERLKKDHAALQAGFHTLQAQQQKQEIAAALWLEQRTRELKAEAEEQKKAETLQRVFYRIAERAAAGLSFYDFLQTVHGLLGELLKSGGQLLGFASGGEPPVGRPSLVGERGPELFVPRTAGTIIPAAQTARIGGGVVVNQVIHVTTTGPGDRRSMAQLQADIGIATQRAIARNT